VPLRNERSRDWPSSVLPPSRRISTTMPDTGSEQDSNGASFSDMLLSTAPNLLLSSDVAHSYLGHLLSLPLDSLRAEPSSLTELTAALDSDLASLCYRSAPSFLASHAAHVSIETSFSALDDSLASLFDSLSSLDALSRSFSESTSSLVQERTRLDSARESLDAAHDVLQMPRLVADCVRAGLWSEALDVASRVPSDLTALRREVDGEIDVLRARVLESLAEPTLKLPGASRAVGLLIRMDADGWHQDELGWALLVARWKALDVDPASDGLKRYTERWREVVGDAVAMFTSIFLSPRRLVPDYNGDDEDGDGTRRNTSHEQLQVFLHHALSALVDAVETHLPSIDNVAALSSLLTQLAYASNAFSRHGLDLSFTLERPFVERTKAIVAGHWSRGTDDFVASLSSYSVLPLTSSSSYTTLSSASDSPPFAITAHPPLARLLNAHITGLNELRLLPALELYPVLSKTQAQELDRASEELKLWSSGGDGAGGKSSEVVVAFEQLRDWCRRALGRIYGVELMQGGSEKKLVGAEEGTLTNGEGGAEELVEAKEGTITNGEGGDEEAS
jgi:hypothetical protein